MSPVTRHLHLFFLKTLKLTFGVFKMSQIVVNKLVDNMPEIKHSVAIMNLRLVDILNLVFLA